MGRGPLAAGLALAVLAAARAVAGPVVSTDGGRVEGMAQGAGGTFRGIPYAAPPTGPLRWRPPQPVASWTGVRPAAAFGPNCPQPVLGDEGRGEPQSEDCLTLNVITPDLHAKNLPVLVSIHGGAFFVGSGRYLLAKDMPDIVRRGVVLVSPNYRLGWLGFFAHPALTRSAHGEELADYWLMDQIAALKWVKRNIARFGGDPDNVTILGCSAGGSSVHALVASPLARGLFAKASAHSGGGLFNATHPLAEKEAQGLAFATRMGVDGTGPDIPSRLRALKVSDIVAAEAKAPPDFGPIIDGRLLPEPIPVAYARGDIAHVPLVIGSTDNEASIFGLMGFDKGMLSRRFGVDVDALAPAYSGPSGPPADKELLRQVQTDFIFTSASLGLSAMAAKDGNAVYAYNFGYVPADARAKTPGAPHCADMAYTFGEETAPDAEGLKVSAILQDYLINFMRSGDPNGAGLPPWPLYTPGGAPLVVTDTGARAEPGFRARQLEPWYAKAHNEYGIDIPR